MLLRLGTGGWTGESKQQKLGVSPANIIDVRDIVGIEDSYKNKISHFLVKLADYELHLKCDNYDVKNNWIKAIRYMKDKFKNSSFFNSRKYKEEINDEVMLQIYAENEQKQWEKVKVA